MKTKSTVGLCASMMFLIGCGGGGGDSDAPAISNTAPVVSAGQDTTADELTEVRLVATVTDAEDNVTDVEWNQISGTAVTITNRDTLTPTFFAPALHENETLIFQITVGDAALGEVEALLVTDLVSVEITATDINECRAILGPIVDATVTIFSAADTGFETPISTRKTTAGLIEGDLGGWFNVLNDSTSAGTEWHVVRITGGIDVDRTDDGLLDDSPTESLGHFYGIFRLNDLTSGYANVTALSDMVYLSLRDSIDLRTATNEQIQNFLDENTNKYVSDINDNGVVNYDDLVRFDPFEHADIFSVIDWEIVLTSYISLIHDGIGDAGRFSSIPTQE